MSNIDEQFVEYIVKSLVSNPEGVSIDRTIDEKGVLLKLSVDQEDLGRVIGKRGATAQSIRTLLRALGTKNDARYNLKIVDTGEGGDSHGAAAPAAAADDATASDDSVADNSADEDTAETAQEADAAAEEETPVDEEPQEAVEEEESLAERTRKELDDLDDLEI